MSGWIKLHRSLLDWEWYEDVNAMRLLVHLLLTVNYEDKKWKGTTIKAGSMVLSWSTLSESCGLTIKQCRGAMKKLENSKEVVRIRTNKYQVVTLVKWEKFQSKEKERAGKGYAKGQTEGQAKGRQRATTKESKEYKESKEVKNITPLPPKDKIFNSWLEYRKEIKKPIKSEKTLESLAKKFDSVDLKTCEFVVNESIQNQWQGLFWDKAKDQKPDPFKNMAF